ncbi:uncharacterized protein DFL_000214 [Arthrobotrys flagrans]|uniref:Uncharacterized protein n=1 Tax=Arthrobotrys flagrans TaxID=97331 RepID=A0A437ADK4_ARTFL|nr:hypothetical protein DFL_000214 [Arthrobotrys flagrans]
MSRFIFIIRKPKDFCWIFCVVDEQEGGDGLRKPVPYLYLGSIYYICFVEHSTSPQPTDLRPHYRKTPITSTQYERRKLP